MEYTGWSLYDEVIFVVSNSEIEYKGNKYRQAYLVNPKDKKQLERATNWGRTKRYDKSTGSSTVIEPTIITTENSGFELSLFGYAGSCSRGGKLSFWNCLIKKEEINLQVVVGIDTALLFEVLQNTTFINGTCQEELSFARCQGGVGLLHFEMKSYKDAVRDNQLKKDITKKKTKKWQLGYEYRTLTESAVYLGKFYRPIKIRNFYSAGEVEISDSGCIYAVDSYNHRSLSEFTKMSDYINNLEKKLDDKYTTFTEQINKGNKDISLVSIAHALDSIVISGHLEKLPARQQGERYLELDIDDYEDRIDKLLVKMKEYILDAYNKYEVYINLKNLNDILINTKSNKLTNLDIQILNKTLENYRKSNNKWIADRKIVNLSEHYMITEDFKVIERK